MGETRAMSEVMPAAASEWAVEVHSHPEIVVKAHDEDEARTRALAHWNIIQTDHPVKVRLAGIEEAEPPAQPFADPSPEKKKRVRRPKAVDVARDETISVENGLAAPPMPEPDQESPGDVIA